MITVPIDWRQPNAAIACVVGMAFVDGAVLERDAERPWLAR